MNNITKLTLSSLFFILSLSFLGFTAANTMTTGSCKNCGSVESCQGEGDSYLECGYADCKIVPYPDNCLVEGYGGCSASDEQCFQTSE